VNNPIKPPSFKVPSGIGALLQVEGFEGGPYTAHTWTGKEQLASDGVNMPVVGASRLAGFHNWNNEDGSISPLDPLPAGWGKYDPLWAVQGYPIALPRELILVADQTVFDAFTAAHLSDLIAGRVFLNSVASSRYAAGQVSWGNTDITQQFPVDSGYDNAMWPTLLHFVPSDGVQTIAIEQSNFDYSVGSGIGTTTYNQNVATTSSGLFIGGQRLLVAAVDMGVPLAGSQQGSYACYYSSTGSADDTYTPRTALMNAHKARVIQTDPYWDKISRVFHLFYSDGTLTLPANSFISDFTALANSCGNCAIVNQGHTTLSAALTAGQIWNSYVKPFFGL
jgi:hypothetical protein